MKKIFMTTATLTSVALPTLSVVACSTDETYTMNTQVVTTGYSGALGGIQSKTYDFAGAWADARNIVSGAKDKIVATGVEKFRIANDGIQAKESMTTHDMGIIQDLFVKMIRDQNNPDLQITIGGKTKSLFSVYSHSDYKKITSTSTKVQYIDKDEPKQTQMVQKDPATNLSGNDGKIFEPKGNAGDYSDYKMKSGASLTIQFIPSNNPADASLASEKLQQFLNNQTNISNVTVNVSSEYNAAAVSLKNGTIDLAFLPVNTWAEMANKTNFILQASRPTQVATLDFDGQNANVPRLQIVNQANAVLSMNAFSQLYLEDLIDITKSGNPNLVKFKAIYDDDTHKLHPFALAAKKLADEINAKADKSDFLAGSYESFIFANSDESLTKDILANYDSGSGNDWKMEGKEVLKDKKYAATSSTSSASWVFPQLWFYRHFKTAFKA